ncbi:MAG: polyprenyl diphosphate synthase [Patescibacteria group bacterium]
MAKEKQNLNHLAVIPDGNSRWADANGVKATEGYKKGMNRIIELTKASKKLNIHTLTIWGLSTENWLHRPKLELDFIVNLLMDAIDEFVGDAMKEGVRIYHLGRKDRLPTKLVEKLAEIAQKTESNINYVLNLALDYGGVDEIIRATQKIAQDVKDGKLTVEDIGKIVGNKDAKLKEYVFNSYLDTSGQQNPYVDYVIRTSGEIRLSGLMPIQAAYSEFYFEPCFFPDFDEAKLKHAYDAYFNRQRRFGGGH